MADDQYETTAGAQSRWLFPHIFRTFRVALDPKKLLLAAAGILVMAAGWWLISVIFYNLWSQPTLERYKSPTLTEIEKEFPSKGPDERERIRREREADRDRQFNEDTNRWLQLHYLAGNGYASVNYQPDETGAVPKPRQVWGGRLRTWPWMEERGPNPFLMVTGQTRRPWESGHFVEWFLTVEVPVLLEPLVKFLEPIVYLLSPNTGTYSRVYLLVIILWTLTTWAFFGGAITRMAVVELAGKDPVSITESLQFVWKRFGSYLLGPIVPLALVGVLVVVAAIFGLFHMIPAVGDVLVSGLFWPFILLIGLGMALLLVGLVGYPMMYPTISAEGSDTLDALSRSYNYVYQSPWSYIFYSVLAILYGAVVIFFIGFMGSLAVYLGKWAVSNTPGIKYADRSPEYLFIYAPTSFGWREVLVSDSPAEEYTRMMAEERALRQRGIEPAVARQILETRWGLENRDFAAAEARYQNWLNEFYVYNHIGAFMVSFWVGIVFLMVLGFGYSFFWTASSMIYLMMRRKVDDIDMDEVYLEETDTPDQFGTAPTTPLPQTAAPPVASVGTTQVQETLSVRNDRPAPPPAPPAAPPAPPAPPEKPAEAPPVEKPPVAVTPPSPPEPKEPTTSSGDNTTTP